MNEQLTTKALEALLKKTPLMSYHFLTGEYVEVKARTVEEAEEKLLNGDYEFIEIHTELKFVGNATQEEESK